MENQKERNRVVMLLDITEEGFLSGCDEQPIFDDLIAAKNPIIKRH